MLLWTIHASVVGSNAAKGVANTAFLLTCDAVCLSLGIIWVICKYKFPNSKFYCYFGMIQYNFVGIWLNLALRSMIPESLFHFEKIAFRDLYDFNRINFVIAASLFMHDFKINALVLYPSLLVQTYFLTDAEVTLINELGQAPWTTDAQKNGHIELMMQRAFFLGLVIIASNYSTQREYSQV